MLLCEAGVPPRPAGRLWLVRLPSAFGSLDAVVDHLAGEADKRGVQVSCNRAFVALAAEVLPTLYATT